MIRALYRREIHGSQRVVRARGVYPHLRLELEKRTGCGAGECRLTLGGEWVWVYEGHRAHGCTPRSVVLPPTHASASRSLWSGMVPNPGRRTRSHRMTCTRRRCTLARMGDEEQTRWALQRGWPTQELPSPADSIALKPLREATHADADTSTCGASCATPSTALDIGRRSVASRPRVALPAQQ